MSCLQVLHLAFQTGNFLRKFNHVYSDFSGPCNNRVGMGPRLQQQGSRLVLRRLKGSNLPLQLDNGSSLLLAEHHKHARVPLELGKLAWQRFVLQLERLELLDEKVVHAAAMPLLGAGGTVTSQEILSCVQLWGGDCRDASSYLCGGNWRTATTWLSRGRRHELSAAACRISGRNGDACRGATQGVMLCSFPRCPP